MKGGSVDGSVAYQQFQQSDNPYSPIFLKNRTGTVTVAPLQSVKPADKKAKKNARDTGAAAQPGRSRRSV